jgi:flagellar basal body P-ring formation protein FlgA
VLSHHENLRGNSGGFARHFKDWPASHLHTVLSVDKSFLTCFWRACLSFLALLVVSLGLVWVSPAHAQGAGEPTFVMNAATAEQVRTFVYANRPAGNYRVMVEVGALDARLRLAPCTQVEPYLPFGARAWGRSRIGLRCLEGARRWNVSVPVTVKAFGAAWVANAALPMGHVIAQEDLRRAEIDLAAEPSAALEVNGEPPVGRTLARALVAGDGLRESHLKLRQWFAAGESVQVRAVGKGFAIAGSGEAVSAGLEGQTARIRLESGRVLTGRPVGERLVEVLL